MDTKIITIDLDSRSYDIFVGSGLLFRLSDFIPYELEGRSCFIVTDQNVEHYAQTVRHIVAGSGASKCEIHVLPAGEKTKSLNYAEQVVLWLLDQGIDRNSLVFAVGGGVVGDIAGFCASVVLRGVPYIQIPTTLQAIVDSSVGGKTGINTRQGKNLVGSFYQPAAVIADIDTLKTLPERELRSGYAEIVKYGLLGDAAFFEWLEKNGRAVCMRDQSALVYAIEQSVRAKAQIVQADEREQGRRALLNLGHTFGHALELASKYDGSLLHGEAVAIGMVMAFDLSLRMGLVSQKDLDRVREHLSEMRLWVSVSEIEPELQCSADDLIGFMAHDKKAAAGRLGFILVNGIGDAFFSNNVALELLYQVLADSIGQQDHFSQGIKEKWKSLFSSLS